ncbi:hypothetical protein phiFa_73 [Thermus phage phiFa]|nr:hypothetical protein phiFa_73 [Thermus phage phiFa]
MLSASFTRPVDTSRTQYLFDSYQDDSNFTGVYWKAGGGLYIYNKGQTLLLANDVSAGYVHRLEVTDDRKVYLDGTLVATLASSPVYGHTVYLGKSHYSGTEWTGGCGFFEFSPELKAAATTVDASNVREDLLDYPSALSRNNGTPSELVFGKVLSSGSLGLADEQAIVEPYLDAPFELWIDEYRLPYPVTEWSFTPSDDVVVDDVGYGPVRVAWPELQASGTLTLVVEDIPATDIANLRTLLLRPKSKRWLAFRGRRYQADEFEFSEKPDKTRFGEFYTVRITANVYRPYVGLPPVPGTRIWPILSVRRMHGSVYARIKRVFVVYPKMFVVHTEGVFVVDLETGESAFKEAQLLDGLDATYWYTDSQKLRRYAVAVLDQDSTPTVFFLQENSFTSRVLRPSVTASRGRFFGKKLLLQVGQDIQYLDIDKAELNTYVQNATVNLAGTPILLSSTALDNAVYPADDTTLWAVPAGIDRVLVAKTTGLYIYEAVPTGMSYQLTSVMKTLVEDTIANAGYFGKPGFLEGYWYTRVPQTQTMPWYPVGKVPAWSNYATDSDGDGYTDNVEVLRYGHIYHQSAVEPVYWSNLVGVATYGFAYFPYTDKLVFRVEILL